MSKNKDVTDQLSKLSFSKITSALFKKLDNFGSGSSILIFINAGLSIICALSLSVWMYVFFPMEEKLFVFFIWVLLSITGAYFFGWISDKGSRKRFLLLTQILGILGIWILKKYGFNIPTIMALSFLYNPTPIVNAILITFNQKYNYKTYNGKKIDQHKNPKVIAFSVLCQAFPWLFFGKIQAFGIQNSLDIIYWFSVFTLLSILFSIKEIKPIIDRKTINHKQIIGSSLSLLTAFLFAESVYFISALVFKSDTFFILAGAGVTTGAILHFLPHKDYHLSYPTLISSSYFLGGLLMFLGVIGGYLMGNASAIKVFVGIIACIGAIYIPLVYSRLFQLFDSRKLGEASGICEGVQGIASVFAPVILEVIKDFHLSFYLIGSLLGSLFFIAFLINIFSKGVIHEKHA